MGISILKGLVQNAQEMKDVVTVEATVITGFEFQAVDECREKCQPIDVFRGKGRIFFNIPNQSFSNVYKLRSIDNVFIVSEVFEDLKFTQVKEEDTLKIKDLVGKVNWSKSVGDWAKIVGFNGVQFPKCAERSPDKPFDESQPICQNCKNTRKDVDEGEHEISPSDGHDGENDVAIIGENVSSQGDVISDREFITTPEESIEAKANERDCTQSAETKAQTAAPDVTQNLIAEDSPVPFRGREDSDDEAVFLSAEEDVTEDEPKEATSQDLQVTSPNGVSKCETIDCTGVAPADSQEASIEPQHATVEPQTETENPQTEIIPPDANKSESSVEVSNAVFPTDNSKKSGEGKKKSYWQKRKEAKKAKKPEGKGPKKPYIDDGILKFRATCYRNGGKHSFDSNDAAMNFGGLLNDTFHWTVDLTRFDLNVVLTIEDDSAYVSLGVTKSSFHRRNIKNFGPTTLRATLCYSLVRLAQPRVGDIVIDPMCGGGSISIEGALGFPGTYNICGDINDKCVERMRANLAHNSEKQPLLIDGFRWNCTKLSLRDQSVDILVTDLPFGLRVGHRKDNTGLYTAALRELARIVRCGTGRASLLTYDKTSMIRALQKTSHLWREIRSHMVNQGGLRCFVFLLLRKADIPKKDTVASSAAPSSVLAALPHGSEETLHAQESDSPEPNVIPDLDDPCLSHLKSDSTATGDPSETSSTAASKETIQDD